ncbi:universal stress protein [Desulfurispora thermophila]|uniref:universal stress protein n=1 Tax=Desulfurispora thermophila TaxID=265470 RepID=UPI00036D7704|nr:universal stress protein [Desulfurispora thermophila]
MSGKILVAFDGSEQAVLAVRWAARMQRLLPQTACIVLAVVSFTGEEAAFLGASAGAIEQAREKLQERLNAAVCDAFPAGTRSCSVVLREGDPGREILKYAAENAVSHIVLGSRGLGGIKGALLGSVSSRVIREAACPVTVINLRAAQYLAGEREEHDNHH